MKKFIALLLTLVLMGTSAIVLSSCGNNDNTSKSEEKGDSFEWPEESDLASLLPDPKAKSGEVTYDSSSSFDVDIKDYTEKQFKDYVKECKEKGFKVDYTSWEDYFSAKNKDGYSLSIDYDKDKNTMSISIYAPSDDDDDEDEEETKEATKSKSKTSSKAKTSSKTKSSKSKSGVSADFKKTMDDYEAFVDKYVAFMKKYNNSDDVAGMLSEYSDMMSKYNDYVQKINKIDEDSLSADDAAYYVEVTGRVAKKLAEIGE